MNLILTLNVSVGFKGSNPEICGKHNDIIEKLLLLFQENKAKAEMKLTLDYFQNTTILKDTKPVFEMGIIHCPYTSKMYPVEADYSYDNPIEETTVKIIDDKRQYIEIIIANPALKQTA